jgi:hypothetical protein
MNTEPEIIVKKRGRPRKIITTEIPVEKPTIGRPRQYDRNDIALIKQVKKQNNTQYYNNRGYFISKVKYYMNKHPDLNIKPDTYIDKSIDELKDILKGIEVSLNEKRLKHIQAKQAEIAEKKRIKTEQRIQAIKEKEPVLLQKIQESPQKIEIITQKQQQKLQKQQEKNEIMKQKQAEKLQKQQEKNEIMKQKQADKLQKQQQKLQEQQQKLQEQQQKLQEQQQKKELMKQKQAEKLQKQQQKKEQAINMKIERITQPDKPVANNFKPRQIKMKIM